LYLVLATRFTVGDVEWVALAGRDAIRQIARKSMANDEARMSNDELMTKTAPGIPNDISALSFGFRHLSAAFVIF
jgi:hypothetical protein